MAGSSDDLSQLVSMVTERTSLLFDALPVAYQHLRIANIPSRSARATGVALDTQSTLATLSLQLIVAGVDSSEEVIDRKVVESLKERWTMIWQWSEYLLKIYLARLEFATTIDDPVYRSIHWATMALFARLVQLDDFRTLMANTQGFIKRLAIVWKAELEPIIEQPISVSNVLHRLITSVGLATSYQSLFLATLDVPHDVVADMVLRHIYHAIQSPRITTFSLSGHLAMLAGCLQTETLLRPLLAKGSISAILRVMARLTIQFPTYDRIDLAKRCLVLCAGYLAVCFASEGFTWILRALEGRLVLYIFKSARILWAMREKKPSDDSLGVAYASVLNVISPFIIYRPILRQARRSVKTVDSLVLHRLVDPAGPFGLAWVAFKKYTAYRTQYKVAFDDMFRDGEDATFCSNKSVRRLVFSHRVSKRLTCASTNSTV